MFILKDSCKGEAICLGPLVSQHILAGCTNPGCRPWLLLIRQHLSLCLRKATLRDEVIFLPEQGRLASTYYQGSASPQVSCSFPVSATHLFSSIHRVSLSVLHPWSPGSIAVADTPVGVIFSPCHRVWSPVHIHEILIFFLLAWKR